MPVMMNLFIDSNIYLSLYGYGLDDLKKLERFAELIDKDQVSLFVTTQVDDEVERNRDSTILEALKTFGQGQYPTKLPLLIDQDLKEAKKYLAACNEAAKLRGQLVEKHKVEARDKKLKADVLYNRVVRNKKTIRIAADKFLEAAERRKAKGNPPGSGNAFGDQLNWECLISTCPDADLHIVSKDGDFGSRLDDSAPNSFLRAEWRDKKKSGLYL